MMNLDKGTVYALAAALMWTVPATVTRILLSEMSPAEIVFLRTLLGTAVLFFIIMLFDRGFKAVKSVNILPSLILGFFFFSTLYSFAVSVQLTTIANAQFLTQMDIVITFLLAHFVLKEFATKRLYAALALSVLGSFTIFFSEIAFVSAEGAFGALAGLGSAVFFAFYTIAARRFFRKTDHWTMVFVFLFGSLFGAIASGISIPTISPYFWQLLLLLGLFTSIPYLLFAWSLKYTQPQRPAIIGKLTVVTTPLFAFIVLGEIPLLHSIIGGFIIFFATLLVILERPPNRFNP